MRILFVCRHNKFRSKVAEAIFHSLRSGIEVKSAGVVKDLDPFVEEGLVELLVRQGYQVVSEQSQMVSDQLLAWADKIVIVADDVSSQGFPAGKVERWEIKDAHDGDPLRKKVIAEIEWKVKELVKAKGLK